MNWSIDFINHYADVIVQSSCRLDQNQVVRKFNGTIGLALRVPAYPYLQYL
jgi:hypothetical protein